MNRALVWSFLLLLPNLVFVAVADDRLDALIRTLPPAFAMITAVICWTRRPGFALVLLSPFYFLLPFEIYYILYYGQPSTPHILAVISESNPTEAIEYFGLARIMAGAAMGLALTAATLWIAFRAPRLPAHRMVRILGVVSLLPLALYAWLEWDWSEKRTYFDAYAAQTPLEQLMRPELATPTGAMLSDSYPLGILFRVRDYHGERVRLRAAAQSMLSYDFGATRTMDPAEPEVYVLVIGESARPDRFGINGYGRDTTPVLGKIGNVIGLRNVVTPWPSTRLAVPILLAGQADELHHAPLNRASIISLFKQVGFRTYWISNQAPLGDHDSLIAMHAYEADQVVYTNGGDYTQQSAYDDAMLPVFQRFLGEPARKKFFVIHMLGSHKRYDRRYPPEFDSFQPSLKSDNGRETPENVANSYDNSIMFTDHVLGRIVDAVQNSAPLGALLYISDHGQSLPSAQCPVSGHGTLYEADYRVAALLWASTTYVDAFPEIWNTAQQRRDAPLYSLGAFHALADMAHIAYRDHERRSSWVSASWTPLPRWTTAAPDFDLARREPPCQKLRMPR
jgi:glucan phosphoethanolaminetransferase (alkaline phosphatase superfamily)